MKMLTLKKLTPFFIGRGTERMCFLAPQDAKCVIKLSPVSHAKQTQREVRYFRFLQGKGIPFLHLPEFKGTVNVEGYTGFKQEAVLEEDGTPSPSLVSFIREHCPHRKEIFALLNKLYQYLWHYNILPCDLHPDNILVQRRGKHTRLVLIDGLGSMNFINFSQYVPWLGRKKIERKWKRFIVRDIEPFFASK